MAVQPEDINKVEQIIFAREAQPDLCDWLVAKFNTLATPRALLGVAMIAIALIEKDNE